MGAHNAYYRDDILKVLRDRGATSPDNAITGMLIYQLGKFTNRNGLNVSLCNLSSDSEHSGIYSKKFGQINLYWAIPANTPRSPLRTNKNLDESYQEAKTAAAFRLKYQANSKKKKKSGPKPKTTKINLPKEVPLLPLEMAFLSRKSK